MSRKMTEVKKTLRQRKKIRKVKLKVDKKMLRCYIKKGFITNILNTEDIK